MPNLAFQLEVLDKVIAKLVASGDARDTIITSSWSTRRRRRRSPCG